MARVTLIIDANLGIDYSNICSKVWGLRRQPLWVDCRLSSGVTSKEGNQGTKCVVQLFYNNNGL